MNIEGVALVNWLVAKPVSISGNSTGATAIKVSSANQTANTNGFVKFAKGGYISGAGGPTSDMIPAMLSNGEYVVKASSVSSYGKGMLDAINSKRFATGGLINAYAIGGTVGNNDSGALNDNSVYNINVSAATNANPDEIAQAVMKAIQREKGSMSTNRYAGTIR